MAATKTAIRILGRRVLALNDELVAIDALLDDRLTPTEVVLRTICRSLAAATRVAGRTMASQELGLTPSGSSLSCLHQPADATPESPLDKT